MNHDINRRQYIDLLSTVGELEERRGVLPHIIQGEEVAGIDRIAPGKRGSIL